MTAYTNVYHFSFLIYFPLIQYFVTNMTLIVVFYIDNHYCDFSQFKIPKERSLHLYTRDSTCPNHAPDQSYQRQQCISIHKKLDFNHLNKYYVNFFIKEYVFFHKFAQRIAPTSKHYYTSHQTQSRAMPKLVCVFMLQLLFDAMRRSFLKFCGDICELCFILGVKNLIYFYFSGKCTVIKKSIHF